MLNLLKLHSSIVYLLAPTLGYMYYSEDNSISKLWVSYMPISATEYFTYILPALIFYFVGLDLFHSKKQDDRVKDNLLIMKSHLVFYRKNAYILIVTGFCSYFVALIAPSFLSYVFNILFLTIFPGLFYLAFNRNRSAMDTFILISVIGWILLLAIKSTMFTIVAYMGVCVSGLILYNFKWKFIYRFLFSVFGLLFLLTVQYTKLEMREFRKVNKAEISVRLFMSTFVKNTTITATGIDPILFFPIYIRINQGRLTANVLKNIPTHRNHDSGEMLLKSIISSFVPRLFWPDKPMAGGRFNMKYYANMNLDKASMNVGPLGEAYGAFGKSGGFIYMFFFGAFISFALRLFLRLCLKYPLLIFWMPVIFFQTIYSGETDSMQVFNSILKTSFLLFILFKLFPGLINTKSKERFSATLPGRLEALNSLKA